MNISNNTGSIASKSATPIPQRTSDDRLEQLESLASGLGSIVDDLIATTNRAGIRVSYSEEVKGDVASDNSVSSSFDDRLVAVTYRIRSSKYTLQDLEAAFSAYF